MSSISLIAYTIKVREKRKKSEYLSLDNIQGQTLHSILKECLEKYQTELFTKANSEKAITTKEIKVFSHTITGLMEAGEFGKAYPIKDRTNKKVFDKKKDHMAMPPHYFYIHLPDNSTHGYMALVKVGSQEMKGIFCSCLKTWLQTYDDNLILEVNPIAPHEFIKQFLERGRIKGIEMVKYNIPSEDLCEAEDDLFAVEKGKITVKIEANKTSAFVRIKDRFIKLLRQEQGNLFEAVPNVLNFEADKKFIEVETNGRQRKFNLQNIYNMNFYQDITDEIGIAVDGFPKFEDMDKAARVYIQDLISVEFTQIERQEDEED